MKYIEYITNHTEKAKSYLLEQYKNKPNIDALLASIIQPLQEIENRAHSAYEQMMLSVASDYHLDRLGAIVGVERKARDDDTYRFAINLGIAINNGGGTPEEILAILRMVYENERIEYLEYGTSYFQIYIQREYEPEGIQQLLEVLKPAGVAKPAVVFSPDNDVFRFSEHLTDIAPYAAQIDQAEIDLSVADSTTSVADLEIIYDKLEPLEPTNGFAEIVVNKVSLLLSDGATYNVDTNNELQMILNTGDYTIEGGSKFTEITTI